MDNKDYVKDVVVIIGSGGMGLAIARRLGIGQLLFLADSSEKSLEIAQSELRREGYDVQTTQVDITDYDAVESAAQSAKLTGRIKTIVNTAGLAPGGPSGRSIYNVDLVGTANIIDAFLGVASFGTTLICIASMAGHFAKLSSELETHLATAPRDELLDHPELDVNADASIAYVTSKRGNQLRVQAAASAWGARGARINSISPGVIATPLVVEQLGGPAGAGAQAMIDLSAAGRIGNVAEIANVAAFLAESNSSYITGNDILVDGGAVSARRWKRHER